MTSKDPVDNFMNETPALVKSVNFRNKTKGGGMY